MSLFARKSLSQLVSEAQESGEHTLVRHLSGFQLIMLGIGAIIGAGLFVRTAAAAADHTGPGVTISFIVGAFGCALAGMCYAEFAAMAPVSGSTYAYATMGEFLAWIIGWDLVLEYGLGAATVAIAWAEYFNKFIADFIGPDWVIPYALCHSPMEVSADGVRGLINLPALMVVIGLTAIIARGIQQSALVNSIIVVIKVSIVVMFIVFGWQFINPANHQPLIPEATTLTNSLGIEHSFGGWRGVLSGAGVVFFAFIGFDAVSTAAQETKNPERNMPIGILGSLTICTILYVLFSYVLTGIANYTEFRTSGREASVAYAISTYMPGYSWLAKFVTVAILFGFSSVILVMLLGQSRVFLSMARDGLVPPVFAKIHRIYRTPVISNWLLCVLIGVFAAFVPGDVVGDMTSIGTLFAFALVSLGVVVMRSSNPTAAMSGNDVWSWLGKLGAFDGVVSHRLRDLFYLFDQTQQSSAAVGCQSLVCLTLRCKTLSARLDSSWRSP
jgi:basic amino acid/polyamine antiporter, APA family